MPTRPPLFARAVTEHTEEQWMSVLSLLVMHVPMCIVFSYQMLTSIIAGWQPEGVTWLYLQI